MLEIRVVSLFPEALEAGLQASILGRAAAQGLVRYRLVQLRDYTRDRHRTVDDYAYGGGPGMVLKPEPFFEALDDIGAEGPVIHLSARGRLFEHDDAVRFSLASQLTLLCGHYKDVDHRVAEGLATDEMSIGNFVLSGGEPAALCIIDSVVRLIPGALGDLDSAATDSLYDGLLAAPSYTRPSVYRGRKVPEVLLSGDHGKIAAWRTEQSRKLTAERRPELMPRDQDCESAL